MKKLKKNSSQSNFSSSYFPIIDPKLNSHTSSLFLTAKSTFETQNKPQSSSQQPVTPNLKTSFSWKKTANGFHKSKFLDDKVLTDRLFLDVKPEKEIKPISLENLKKNENSIENTKTLKSFRLKKEMKTKDFLEDFMINDSINENFMKNIISPANEKESEFIHCEE